MNKEDLIRKLTSRKFWAAVCAFVTLLLVALGFKESEATQVAAIIMAGATVLSYILRSSVTVNGASITVISCSVRHDVTPWVTSISPIPTRPTSSSCAATPSYSALATTSRVTTERIK